MPCNFANILSIIYYVISYIQGFPGGSVVKNPPANAGGSRSTPGSGRSPGAGHGNSLQYSCLENPTGRGAWWATAHGSQESDTTQ